MMRVESCELQITVSNRSKLSARVSLYETKVFDQVRRLVTIRKYVCSSAYKLTDKLRIFVKAMSFRLVIAQSQICFEAFCLWFLANNEKSKNWINNFYLQ